MKTILNEKIEDNRMRKKGKNCELINSRNYEKDTWNVCG